MFDIKLLYDNNTRTTGVIIKRYPVLTRTNIWYYVLTRTSSVNLNTFKSDR